LTSEFMAVYEINGSPGIKSLGSRVHGLGSLARTS